MAMNVYLNGARSCNWTVSNASKLFWPQIVQISWCKCIDFYISFKKICRLHTGLSKIWNVLYQTESALQMNHYPTHSLYLHKWFDSFQDGCNVPCWMELNFFSFYSRLVCNLLEKLTSTISFSCLLVRVQKVVPDGQNSQKLYMVH